MSNNICSLVIMAAGMGSRFGGGIKQLSPVGPDGELIIDYSIFDAVRAGFKRLVIVLREDIKEAFDEVIGARAERFCAKNGVEVKYVYQRMGDLPEGFTAPENRAKPWGTAHVLYACRDCLDGPFAVINADDYYGCDTFRKIHDFLSNLPENSTGKYCLAGFSVENTLSENGSVTRGVCGVNSDGKLTGITETSGIIKTENGAAAPGENGMEPIALGTPVSMNMWGFTQDMIATIEREFVAFLKENAENNTAEFLIPILMGSLIKSGAADVTVLPTDSRWYGMTYKEDMPAVSAALLEMVENGTYKKGVLKV